MKSIFLIKQAIALVLSIFFISYSNAQVEDYSNTPVRRITLDVEDMALEDLLALLQKEMEVPVAYAIDNIPTEIFITIHVNEVSLSKLFELICWQAKLTCEFIDGYYILKNGSQPDPIVIIQEKETGSKDKTISFGESSDSINPQNTHGAVSLNSGTLLGQGFISNKRLSNHGINSRPERLQKIAIIPIIPKESTGINRNVKSDGLIASVVYSLDFHQFHFKPGLTTDQYYQSEWNYSLGLSENFSLPLNRVRVSIGVLFSSKDFSYVYNYRVLDLDDPIPIPDVTMVQTTYLEVPINLLYQLIKFRKFTCSLSGGYHASFLMKKSETTSYQNTEDQKTDKYLSSTASYLDGISLGVKINYSIGKKWVIDFEPQFVQYFNSVNSEAMKSPTELLRVKAGIAYII